LLVCVFELVDVVVFDVLELYLDDLGFCLFVVGIELNFFDDCVEGGLVGVFGKCIVFECLGCADCLFDDLYLCVG